jgi:hypothetical protein
MQMLLNTNTILLDGNTNSRATISFKSRSMRFGAISHSKLNSKIPEQDTEQMGVVFQCSVDGKIGKLVAALRHRHGEVVMP